MEFFCIALGALDISLQTRLGLKLTEIHLSLPPDSGGLRYVLAPPGQQRQILKTFITIIKAEAQVYEK